MSQPVTATQDWRQRMAAARVKLKKLHIGQQEVLEWITVESPDINKLTLSNKWRNAWSMKVSNVEFTLLVESAAEHFKKQAETTTTRLGKQRLGSGGRKKAITQST